jgi:hypothetical protein
LNDTNPTLKNYILKFKALKLPLLTPPPDRGRKGRGSFVKPYEFDDFVFMLIISQSGEFKLLRSYITNIETC